MRHRALAVGILYFAVAAAGAVGALGSQISAVAGHRVESANLAAQSPPADALRALLSPGSLPPAQIGAESVALLTRFYAARSYAPLWIDAAGVGPAGKILLARLSRAEAAGQTSVSPLLAEAAKCTQSSGGQAPAECELLLSAALVGAAIDPSHPAAIGPQPRALAAIAGSDDPLPIFRDLLPVDPAFWRLRDAISAYRGIAARGGWPRLPPGPKLELGVVEPRVAVLRQRLRVSGDLVDGAMQPDSFDGAVDAAVRQFQARHGLQVDGVVGANTLAALNISAFERIAALDVNLRRLQQQHREWDGRYVVVNAAAATYRLIDRGRQVFERAAIVGRRGWPTPQLDSAIDRIEFNPDWIVPPRIARLEVLPRIRREPDYMVRNDMHWVNGQIRQNPGPKNPLGKVKFLFPNRYDVYLHDTNSPALFERWDRFLSHGCMRIVGALDLAAYLLSDDPLWSAGRIDDVVQSGQTVQVRLATPVPLHVVYDTAWVDDAGVVNFRADIYGRDGRVGGFVANAASDHRQLCGT